MKSLFLGHFAATVAPRILAKVKTPLETSILDDESDAARLAPLLADAEIVVGHIWRAGFPSAPRLRLLQSVAAGLDLLDTDAVPKGVTVCNVFGHEPAIAEYVIMTIGGAETKLRNNPVHPVALGSRMAATRGRAHRRAADLERVNQWKSARTTNAIERLHEELKHRIKTPDSAALGRDRSHVVLGAARRWSDHATFRCDSGRSTGQYSSLRAQTELAC
jgi:hypothetical protein